MSQRLNDIDILDLITVLSFLISIENLDQNLTQNDKQELQQDLSEKAERLLNEIHGHLEAQDKRLSEIIERLEKIENDSR